MNTRFRFMVVFVGAAALVGMVSVIAAQAQGDEPSTPTPAPSVREEADAPAAPQSDPNVAWTVGEITFTSNFPAGFSFTAEISSGAGPIERGRVIWSHAPGTQRSRPIEVDADTGLVRSAWDATDADAVPPWVGVTYYFDVGDAAGNSFQTEPQFAEYEDTSREWVRTEGEDIIVFAYNLPPDVGPMTVEAMAQQRETYRGAWGELLPYTPRAILFGDRAAYLEWQITPANPRSIGTTRSDWGSTVQVVSGGNVYDLAYGTVLHEVGHLYQSEYTIMAVDWFNEGNATFFELNQQYDYERRVRLMAANGTLPTILQGTGPSIRGQNGRDGYDIGYTFWKWWTDTYGLEGHRELIDLLDLGVGRIEAIETVSGMSAAQVEQEWRIWLGASPIPPTLIPTPTTYFVPIATPDLRQ
ncbi:MAG: hypothetical protein GYB65_22005 [Chloroflexi bacterium]|nr:hypothetical protein [Chloroflexota bacterium]